MKTDEVHLSATCVKELNKINTQMELSNFIREPEYAIRAVYWDEVCLDSTYHAYDTFSTIERIKRERELEQKYKKEPKKLAEIIKETFMTRGDTHDHENNKVFPYQREKEKYRPRVIEEDKIERIVLPFFDDNRGAFKLRQYEPWCDVYSSDDAWRMTYSLTKGIPEKGIPETLAQKFEKVFDYYISCRDKEFGAFSDTPNTMPTIAMTFSAMLPLYELIKYLKEHRKKAINLNSVFSQKKLTKFVEIHRREYDSTMGYVNTIYDDEPLLCSTFYALSIMEQVASMAFAKEGVEKDKEKILKEVIDKETGEKILEFVELCWKEKEGGYSSSPTSPVASLIHTRYAILILNKLINAEIVELERVQENFKPTRILQFINDCSQPDGGFAITNIKEMMSSIYSTRYAVKILRYLEVLRMREVIDVDQNYQDEFKKIDEKKIEEFLKSCYDNETGCYTGLPFCGELENTEKNLVESMRKSVRKSGEVKIRKNETNYKKLRADRSLRSLAPAYFALGAVFLALGIIAIYSTITSQKFTDLLFFGMYVLLASLLFTLWSIDRKGVKKKTKKNPIITGDER